MVRELTDKHLRALNRGRKAKGLKPIRRKKIDPQEKKDRAFMEKQYKNKSINMSGKKHTYKASFSARGKEVQLKKNAPNSHIREMFADWGVDTIQIPKGYYTRDMLRPHGNTKRKK